MPITLNQTLWRAVHENRDPCQCSKPGGRWDDECVEVLYTSAERDGALAEMYFHLRKGQPVIPSKVAYRLYELQLNLDGLVDLTDKNSLSELGVDIARYGKLTYANKNMEYQPTQQIGEAAHFLGFNGILVPNARWNCNNVVLFCDRITPDQLDELQDHGVIDWKKWEKNTEGVR